MMDLTDRHCRYFLRQLSRCCVLYTEMYHAEAVIRGDRQRLLAFHESEPPLVLQLGGSDPTLLAKAAKIADEWGYDEINLNVGCPSDRVQAGQFGACLMAHPQRVAAGVDAMQQAVAKPISVKTRLGIDYQDDYEFLATFVQALDRVGCRKLVVHARKAWLSGLSPKENREIPPLDYERVYRLKRDFPHFCITINGGVTTLEAVQQHLLQVDGVMIGRAAYQNPYLLALADEKLWNISSAIPSRFTIAERLLTYAAHQQAQGVPLSAMTRHWMGLFQGQPGARHWRRCLSELPHAPNASVDTLRQAFGSLAPAVMSLRD